MGVDLFFVLSGFLITGILLSTREKQHYFRNFLARRFLRIWPLYYANLIIFFIVVPLILPHAPAELEGMIDKQAWFWLYGANWLFAIEHGFNRTNGGYFWSLAVEEQFYLVWPLVVYWLSTKALMRVSIGLLCSSLILRLALAFMGVNLFSLYTVTFTHLDGLAIGAILAIALRSPEGTARLTKMLPYCAAIGVGAIAVARMRDGALFFWSHDTVLYGYTAVALLGGCALLWALRSDSRSMLSRILTSRPLSTTGRLSYALYLIHAPAVAFASMAMLPVLAKYFPQWSYGSRYCLMLAFVMIGSWSLAALSWHFFEKRILSLKDRFAYETSPSPASVDSAIAASVAAASAVTRLPASDGTA
jgi:peptidoglycan/LPS O-acetylase OafA/YrhL